MRRHLHRRLQEAAMSATQLAPALFEPKPAHKPASGTTL